MKYFVTLDGETTEVCKSLTLGRHLDNDLLIGGEDVQDFHLRIAPSSRGLEITPLGEAVYVFNGRPRKDPCVSIPGDKILVGQSELNVTIDTEELAPTQEWWLYAQNEDSVYKLVNELHIGRADDSEILLIDEHISRHHAVLMLNEVVWVKDLGSANGTYINGTAIHGGARLFHGDQVQFDKISFQLVGRGDDLTPLRRQDTPSVTALVRPVNEAPQQTTQIAVSTTRSLPVIDIPTSNETGAFFLGASDPIAGQTFRARMGRMLIGRDEGCEIHIMDSTVSSRHAELVMRPEGCVLTNLMATNGTRVNGTEIQSVNLVDGDVLRLGQVSMVFKDVPVTYQDRRLIRRTQWALLLACLMMGGVLLWNFL